MTDTILPLSSNHLDLRRAGGKGANLHRLFAAGFPVPPAFVITTPAYLSFVESNNLMPIILQNTQDLEPDAPGAYAPASDAIRDAFQQASVPDELRAAISQAYREMGNQTPVAVRSSATAEDLPDASFAGQQDTYLNVQGVDSLLRAVVACWSSLWTARAMAYRARRNIGPEDVALAVIVQEMAPAESAGVLFTVNPVSGARQEMLVNATWGLGEALVAGKVNPDTLVLDRQSGSIKQLELGDKAIMSVPLAGSTAERDVEPQRRAKPSLDAHAAATLAKLGRDIEALFGVPQDVEWALAGGRIYILQSRPVTTLDPATVVPGDDNWPPVSPAPQPFDRWTQADVGERWPEPVTPFTWSTAELMLNRNMRDSFAGLPPSLLQGISWARRAYGRVYFNEGALIHLFSEGYGMPASMAASSLANPEFITEEQDRWQWLTFLRRLPLVVRLTIRWERNARKFEGDFEKIDALVDQFMMRQIETLDDTALWREAQTTWYERLMTYMVYHANVTSTTTTAFGTVESLLERWLDRKDLIYDLTAGLEGVIAAEIVPDLWRMANEVRRAGLTSLFLDDDPAATLAQLHEEPAAAPFLAFLDRFLQRHGHRCMSEAEWLYPRWIEAPERVIATIATYLQSGEAIDPRAAETKQIRLREEALALVADKLNPLQMAYFRRSLRRLRRFMRLRDNGQHFLVKLLLPMRHIYATLGRRWARRGWLADPLDFFFLLIPEIEAVLALHKTGDMSATAELNGLQLRELVSQRRLAYEHWFDRPLPEVLDEDGLPLEAPLDDDEQALSGVPASAGRVQGLARVIDAPGDASRLQPGEILVTRATDPGWTPVFSIISGLVLEVGGQLSHGAIVAREYGLPAVVNVTGATRRIADGQTITVDGSSGRIYLEA